MERRKAKVIRAAEVAASARWFAQRLNPSSRFRGLSLTRVGGLERMGVTWATLPPGRDSFAYHAHDVIEEWMYMLTGQAVALVDGEEIPVGPGDFLAFPAPQAPHLLRNRSGQEVTYLMGGERAPLDVLTYPTLNQRYLLRTEDGRAAFYLLDNPTFPFGPAEEE